MFSEMTALLKYPISERNQLIDAAFYDVDALTDDEKSTLSPFRDREGSIVVVPPRESGRAVRQYQNALQFLIAEETAVSILAVAGVGSSVLGTAALARNVADHYEMDVAGVVSGYGTTDVAAEALGGWFFLRGHRSILAASGTAGQKSHGVVGTDGESDRRRTRGEKPGWFGFPLCLAGTERHWDFVRRAGGSQEDSAARRP